jgi:hypothetical protein
MNKVDKRKQQQIRAKMMVLTHISKRNCALLPYLSDESLHTLGEFIFNVITQRIELDNVQLKKVKRILKKDKMFYSKLIHVNTKDPLGYFRNSLKSDPQVGNGIVSLFAALAPIISSLLFR